jgi:hypothetical protein
MPAIIQVGDILINEWPPMTPFQGVESEPYSGKWSVVTVLDGFALDRKIRASGWHFFFIAAEAKAMFIGAVGAKKVEKAIKRILRSVANEHFNGLEVTGIVAKRFLRVPYAIVSAHSRHVQQNCYLDSIETRRTSDRDAEWARDGCAPPGRGVEL